MQSPAPWYTPFNYPGAHYHRFWLRTTDPTGFRGPDEFDERELKDTYAFVCLFLVIVFDD